MEKTEFQQLVEQLNSVNDLINKLLRLWEASQPHEAPLQDTKPAPFDGVAPVETIEEEQPLTREQWFDKTFTRPEDVSEEAWLILRKEALAQYM